MQACTDTQVERGVLLWQPRGTTASFMGRCCCWTSTTAWGLTGRRALRISARWAPFFGVVGRRVCFTALPSGLLALISQEFACPPRRCATQMLSPSPCTCHTCLSCPLQGSAFSAPAFRVANLLRLPSAGLRLSPPSPGSWQTLFQLPSAGLSLLGPAGRHAGGGALAGGPVDQHGHTPHGGWRPRRGPPHSRSHSPQARVPERGPCAGGTGPDSDVHAVCPPHAPALPVRYGADMSAAPLCCPGEALMGPAISADERVLPVREGQERWAGSPPDPDHSLQVHSSTCWVRRFTLLPRPSAVWSDEALMALLCPAALMSGEGLIVLLCPAPEVTTWQPRHCCPFLSGQAAASARSASASMTMRCHVCPLCSFPVPCLSDCPCRHAVATAPATSCAVSTASLAAGRASSQARP